MKLKLEEMLSELWEESKDERIGKCLELVREIKKECTTFREEDGRFTLSANEFECTECIALACQDYEKLKSACVINKLISRLGEIEHDLL